MTFISDYPNRRTYDPERNVELKFTYGDRDGYENYELLWDNLKIGIGTTKISNKRDSNEKFDVTWNIQKVGIPSNLPYTKSEVLQMVRDAFEAYGLFHDKDRVDSVKINFSPKI